MSRLLLIDGNSLTYRAFFALPTDMAAASGQVTNAVFGFGSMLNNLIRDHEASGIVVAFDLPEPTFRHKRLADYKANRERQPDILYEQLALVRELVEALGLHVVDAAGFEADDVIATLATMAYKEGRDALIVSGDRDVYQLVEDPHIRVLYNKRGVSDYVLYDEEGIKQRTGVSPNHYVDFAALRGDKSDNLPGVPGVGEKTAARLINAYEGLDGVFQAIDFQTPKLKENLRMSEERIRLNAELMTLVRDVPLGLEISDLDRKPVDVERAGQIFDVLELATIRERLGEALGVDFASGGSISSDEDDAQEIDFAFVVCSDSREAIDAMSKLNEDSGPIALGGGFDKSTGELQGLALSSESGTYWLPRKSLVVEAVQEAVRELFLVGEKLVAVHNAKPLVRSLLRMELDLEQLTLDTSLAGYLLEPSESSYELGDLLRHYTKLCLPSNKPPEGQLDLEGSLRDTASEACGVAIATQNLVRPMLDSLGTQGLRDLNDNIEVPLVTVLARMEEIGIGVDVAELTRLRDGLTRDCEQLRETIQEAAGEGFNVNSTKQLRYILFERLKLQPGKRTKTGYSTDAATLERLRDEHPIIGHLLRFRELEKLRSTYGEGLLAAVDTDNRIRATFNQTVTRTGRLSSDAPNLHNIPVRTEAGRAFRRAFIPASGLTMLVADYNQIELRCIAHLSEDPGLLAAFQAGDDIHTAVAARTWSIEPSEVTSDLRNRAKMVAYGLAYGMEAYGLAQRVGVTTEEASEILTAYFAAFPGVRDYMERSVIEARAKGYTETLFGRRRRIPELSAKAFNVRQAGERQAMNAPIQGLAADIFKVALVAIDRTMSREQLASRLVLQVHDEVILEVEPKELEQVTQLVNRTMTEACELKVDLAVDLAAGPSWGDAKE